MFRSISSGSSGSWIGTSPRRSDSTFSGTISRTTTRCPSSAKQAAVTNPTQPAPTTPIGSLSLTSIPDQVPGSWRKPSAILSMSSFDTVSISELETQNEPWSVCQATIRSRSPS